MKEKIKELDCLLAKKLLNYGFKRRKKNTYIKNVNEGVYGINLADTKVKGQEKIHIYVILTFNYERLNNLIMYLMNDYSYKGWESIAVNAINIVPGNNAFGFYIEKNTNLEFIVDQTIEAFEKYGLHIFDDIDTCEKLQKKLYEDNKAIINWLVFKQEWYYLALAIMLANDSVNNIIEKYYDEFNSTEETFAEFMERINNHEKIQEIIK